MTDTLEAVKTHQQFIGGEWADSASGETLEVINPANDQVIAKVSKSSSEESEPTLTTSTCCAMRPV